MSGLTIVLVSTEPARARAALTIALAAAAIGQRARVYAHERAAALLAAAPQANADPAAAELARSGLPDLAALLAMSAEAGVALWACQTGLAMTGLAITDMATGTQAGGLVALLTTLGDDRLLTV